MKVPLYSLQNQSLSNPTFDMFCNGKKQGSLLICENQMTASISMLFNELEIIFANIRV